MNVSLDNITFYSQPPPGKPPPCTFPVSCWKPYETPLASRALSRALPPRAPSPRTTITLPSNARPDVSPRFRAPARQWKTPQPQSMNNTQTLQCGQHVYFMSFLPEEPHQPSMPSTFEGQEEHSRSRDSSVSAHCENQIGNQHSQQPSRKESRAGKSTRRVQALSEDNQRALLYTPQGRKAGNSGRSGQSFNVTRDPRTERICEAVQAVGGKHKDTEGVARQRYGPPPRRQIVDRYSPV
ncbi:predicted protein [Histoplasma capsulatum var. duboisii H88]|uniref:Predicted protein n=1 Tax=Ajellomyces capsulatus (strain H88) TaxID=544711 RepID=F0U768_AJEC8|nr:predicted protein [Histoplasma capsulatum var. duboisii H88]